MGSSSFCVAAASVLALMTSGHCAAENAPFPEALERASIAVPTLDQPINDALILGNGDVNGLLFADGDDLVFRITKNDVWDGRLDAPLDPPLPTLARLKQLGAGPWPDKNWVLPEGSDWEGPDSYHAHAYPCPRACGVVRLSGAAEAPHTAKLCLAHGMAQTYTATGVTRCYVAADANVVVFAGAIRPQLDPVVSDDIPAPESGETKGFRWVAQTIPGDGDWPGMEFAIVCSRARGRSAVAVVTSLESDTPLEAAKALAKAYLDRDPCEALQAHETRWGAFWAQSGIALADPVLERVWYRNLYFLRCVSKPGVVSPGLFAGLLDDKPAWHGDYHTNYNIQQTYWGAYSANHCELAEPYDRLMANYLPRARWLARQVFDMDGAYIPHVLYAYEPPDPAACTNPNGRQYIHHVWGFTLGVAGFSVQPLWWRYKYQPDRDYLEAVAYPAVRDIAVFYAAFVEQCERAEDGRIVLAPTVSPEHHGWTDGFRLNRDCTFCIAYFKALFDAAIEGATTLGTDAELIARWKAAKALLPAYPTHEVPDLGPVVVDVRDADPLTYNIPVPTTPVFPGDQIGWFSSDEERGLFTKTLSNLKHNGNNAPIMLAVTRARLGTADARDWLRTELDRRERPNGTLSFNRIEPQFRFNDFGHYTEMFGAVLPITELLLQSVGDVVRVFPAWPAHLPARFDQLRAQGGFLVSAEQRDGKVAALSIRSTAGGQLRLMSPWKEAQVLLESEGAWEKVSIDGRNILAVETRPGQIVQFRAHE